MKIYNWIKIKINEYKPLSHYVITLILLFILIFIFKKVFYINASHYHLIQLYYNFLIRISFQVYKWFGFNIENIRTGSLLSSPIGNPGKIRVKLLAIRQIFIFLTIAALIPLKFRRKVKLIIFIFLLFQIFILLRIVALSIFIYSSNSVGIKIVSEICILLMNLGLFIIIFHWFKVDFALKKILIEKIKIEKQLLRYIFLNAFYCILVLGFINIFIKTGLYNIDYILTYGIMKVASMLLSFIGYSTEINNYRLLGENHISIHMGYPCIGINLMFVFAAFIAFMKGKLYKKIWYIVFGILTIYLMNIFRITFLYIYLVKNNSHDSFFVDVHDIYSYIVYLIIFFMWVLWIKKFSTSNS